MPRMRGRLYSSCASSTWSLPSALTACWAKMSRISCVRSTTRVESASSSVALLRRVELVVDDQHVGARSPRRASSAPRACPCRRTSAGRAGRAAGRAPRPGRRARCASSSRSSPSSSSASAPLREHGEQEPLLGLEPCRGCRIGGVMTRVCRYARVMTALAQRLAERTLELVDIPSESLHEAAVRSHLLSLVPAAFAPEYAAEDAFVFARPRRPEVPLVLLAGHYDTVPAQDNLPGRIADGAVHGCGATDMKGGVAVALELVRDLALAEPGPGRRGAPPLRQGGAAGAVQPAARPLRALAARVGRRPRDPARADRPDAPGRAASAT